VTEKAKVNRRGHWRQWLQWAVLACLGAAVTVTVGLNLFVQSPEFRGWLKDSLEERMGLPVKWEKIYYTPWRGIVLTEPRVLAPEEARETGGDSLLKAKALLIRPNWPSALRGKRLVRTFRLLDLEIVLVKDQQGHLMMPWADHDRPDGSAGNLDEASESRNERDAMEWPLPPAPPSFLAQAPALLAINNGQLRLLEEGTGRSVLEIRGLDLELPGPRRQTGTLNVKRISLGGTERVRSEWVVDDLDVPIEWRNGVIELRPQGWDAGGGRVEWGMQIQPWLDGVPVAGRFRIMEVDGAALWSPILGENPKPYFAGNISAEGAFIGHFEHPADWYGNGKLSGHQLRLLSGATTWRRFLALFHAEEVPDEIILDEVKVRWRAGVNGLDAWKLHVGGPGAILTGQVSIGFDHQINGTLNYVLPEEMTEPMASAMNRLPEELRLDFPDVVRLEAADGQTTGLPSRELPLSGELPIAQIAPYDDSEPASLNEWIAVWAEAIEAHIEDDPEDPDLNGDAAPAIDRAADADEAPAPRLPLFPSAPE